MRSITSTKARTSECNRGVETNASKTAKIRVDYVEMVSISQLQFPKHRFQMLSEYVVDLDKVLDENGSCIGTSTTIPTCLVVVLAGSHKQITQ